MRVLTLAYVLALGATLGFASARYAVAGRPVYGKVEIGAWTLWPRSGGREIDPYMRAYLARGAHLPLGAGEGLELIASRDDSGRSLEGQCRYLVAGATPPTRGWTLSVTDMDGRPFSLPLARSGFSDAEVVRDEAGNIRVLAAATTEAGNWLPLPTGGPFQLRLRLYDTPISSHAGELRPEALPTVARIDCR